MLDVEYGLTRHLAGVPFEAARERIESALKDEGFGILTSIDVQATLKSKLDVDFGKYVILGACNPTLAYRALSVEPGIGLVLPCNVVVAEETDGSAVISILDPASMMKAVGDIPGLREPMRLARERLQVALAKV